MKFFIKYHLNSNEIYNLAIQNMNDFIKKPSVLVLDN